MVVILIVYVVPSPFQPITPQPQPPSTVTFDQPQSADHTLHRRPRLVATDIVHNLALIAHCQRISQSNRPPHHAHSTMNPFSPSPVIRDLLEDGITCSLLLSPTMVRPNLSPSPKSPATSSDLVPFLCAVILPSFSPPRPTRRKRFDEQQSAQRAAANDGSWKEAGMVHAFAVKLLRL